MLNSQPSGEQRDRRQLSRERSWAIGLGSLGSSLNLSLNSNSHQHVELNVPEVKTKDIYGFEVDAKRSAVYRAFYEKSFAQTQRQIVKSETLIEAGAFKNWSCPYARVRSGAESPHFDKVAVLVRDGLPTKHRGVIWLHLTGVISKVKLYEGVYESLLEPYNNAEQYGISQSASTIQIEKDVPRTFPGYTWTPKGKKFQPSLRNLLRAYAMRNPKLGYCQSMNFIAGGLLLFLDEVEAFWILCFIVEEMLPDYFTKSIIGPQIDAEVLSELMAEQLPELREHFDANSINTVLVCTQWFMCLFIRTLPFECAFRIWDTMFMYGPQILFEAGLGILKRYQKDLLSFNDTIDIVTHLNNSLAEVFDCSLIWEIPIARIDHKRIGASREVYKEKVLRDMKMKAEILDLMDIIPSSKFTREALEDLYVQYANLSPELGDPDILDSGLKKPIFQKVILQIFTWRPQSYFLDRLFRVFDVNKNKRVDFRELVLGLAVLCKGTHEEKLKMCFDVFDAKGDGQIDREELSAMLTSLYTVCSHGPNQETQTHNDVTTSPPSPVIAPTPPPDYASEIAFFVDMLLDKADCNKDGLLSPEEFSEAALYHHFILKAFNLDRGKQQTFNVHIGIGR